jgi:hypothetical protein
MARPTTDSGKHASRRTGLSNARDDRVEARDVRLLSRRSRIAISAVVMYHLLAVFLGAWMGSPPTSPFADAIARPFRTYIGLADLNHGYRFFAPNPGPSHLFRYRLVFADGKMRDGFFPDREEHWPRLFYHRYFMLSENLNVLRPGSPSRDLSKAESEQLLRGFRALADSYAAELLRKNDAMRIDWEYVRHYQALPDDVLGGRELADEEFYETLERGSLERTSQEELP